MEFAGRDVLERDEVFISYPYSLLITILAVILVLMPGPTNSHSSCFLMRRFHDNSV
jgi:hypothetical protein